MIAFFPGKFQPPHLGHVVSVIRLYKKYDKILIGITEDEPSVISRQEARNIFEEVFQYLPKVEVRLIKGVLLSYLSREGLPKFDVLLTGNPDVIEWCNKRDVPCIFVPRSEGLGFSGTFIRKVEKKK